MSETVIERLEAWVKAHKGHSCTIEIDDGYGATCWTVELGRRNAEPHKICAAEVNFVTGGTYSPGVVFVADGDEVEDWPGLAPTITAALDEAMAWEEKEKEI